MDKIFDDPSGIHLANEDYPHINQMDISSVIVPMDNSSNRATGADRAEMMAEAINKTNFDSFTVGIDSSSVDLFLVGTTDGEDKLQIYQEYPGVSGNMINVQVHLGPPTYNYPDISYNTPTWVEIFPLASTNQDSSANYPLKLQRNMDSSGGFIDGQDPVDASQTLVITASGENLTTEITFYLDVERPNETDASGAWETDTNKYEYYVPVGRGLGRRTSEILVSDEMRATRFKRAFNECSSDPSDVPVPNGLDPSGGGEINFLELTATDIEVGTVIYTIDTQNVPLPVRMAATIGGGGYGGYGESYPPVADHETKVNIEALIAGAGSNKKIIYTPDPNKPGDSEGYVPTKFYPLIEKTTG